MPRPIREQWASQTSLIKMNSRLSVSEVRGLIRERGLWGRTGSGKKAFYHSYPHSLDMLE